MTSALFFLQLKFTFLNFFHMLQKNRAEMPATLVSTSTPRNIPHWFIPREMNAARLRCVAAWQAH
jgi:hypothetical protein